MRNFCQELLYVQAVGKREARQKNIEVDLITGEELATLAKEVVVQPPEIVDQMRKLMGE